MASVACVDEAGRGALCGPVHLGVVLITAETTTAPKGVRDSKLLRPERRQELAPRIRRWTAHGVGSASAEEIDELGILRAMQLAGRRAISLLPVVPDCVLLDGHHDYLTDVVPPSLFDSHPAFLMPPVVTRVKADLSCAGVAAASILAKTERDALMVELAAEHPDYGWHENKGYAAPEHVEALKRLGPTRHHRVSWKLPARA